MMVDVVCVVNYILVDVNIGLAGGKAMSFDGTVQSIFPNTTTW